MNDYRSTQLARLQGQFRVPLVRLQLLGAVGLPFLLGALLAFGQTEESMSALASRASIIVLGTVKQVGASEESLVAPSSSTAIIQVRRMFAGSEFAGDQSGRAVTVILSKPGDVKVDAELLFFGNPRFIGKTLTIADIGELPAPRLEAEVVPAALAKGIQVRRDAPIRARLAVAKMVFRGTVESVRVPEGTKENALRDEHDPEWTVAMVSVAVPIRGAAARGVVILVIFPASRDIVWFNSPKLHKGDDVLIVGHAPDERELPLFRNSPVMRVLEDKNAVVVSQPFDVLPASEEKRLAGLALAKEVQ